MAPQEVATCSLPLSLPSLTCRCWLSLPSAALASDLHLDPLAETPRQEAFVAWLERLPAGIPVLLLGDLFDFWIGDDWEPPALRPLFAALRSAAERRLLFFQAGNRDFLAGRRLARRLGWRQLPPLAGIRIAGQPFLLTHGDLLCWEDIPYLTWRQEVRQKRWQRAFLAQPLEARLAFAQALRAHSQVRQLHAPPHEVSPLAVQTLLARYPGAHLIHGHTHRALCQEHLLPAEATPRRRWVLPQWDDAGSCAGRLLTAEGLLAD